MNREVHVRFWERLGVKVPWATRHEGRSAVLVVRLLLPTLAAVLRTKQEQGWPVNAPIPKLAPLIHHHEKRAYHDRYALPHGLSQ